MIPKVINYVWFGKKPKSNFINSCIVSWKEHMPDYDIVEWNESNINIEIIRKNNKFFDECYKRKMYAFMSDYIRLKVLYENGGIYFDTDIQVIKNFDNLLNNSIFIGSEAEGIISAGVIASEAYNPIIKKALDFYEKKIWDSTLYTIPDILTECFKNENNIKILPQKYFYPFYYNEEFSLDCIAKNTYTIHWWGKDWGEKKSIIFLTTKHIKNPIKRKMIYFKRLIGYYFKNVRRILK